VTRYVITRPVHLEGVRLSKPGHRGKVPHANDEDAAQAARVDANGRPIVIDRETIRKTLRSFS